MIAAVATVVEPASPHTVARLAAVPDLQALAKRELATPGRYRLEQRAAPPASWWARVWHWIAERWQNFWRGLFARVHVGKERAASIGDALLAIIAVILLIAIIRLLRNVALTRATSSAMQTEPLGEATSASELYREACDAANRGDHGTAALLLFAAMVALLHGRGAVVAGRSATVGDLRRQLRGRDANLVRPFDAVAAPFVQRAYAERAIDAPQWDRAHLAYTELLSS